MLTQEEKIKKFKTHVFELLDSLNVATQLSEVSVSRTEGQIIYDGIADIVTKQTLNMSVLNNIVTKSLKSTDPNIKRFGESLMVKIHENKYKNALLLVAESVYNNNAMMHLDYNKVFLNDLFDLCESTEEEIENKILNGKLDRYRTNAIVRNIVESIKSTKLVKNTATDSTHKTFVPVSYCYVNENNEHVFTLSNKIYSYDSKKINYFYNVNESHALPMSVFMRTPYNYVENCFVVKSIVGDVCVYTEGEKEGKIVLNNAILSKKEYIEHISKAYNYSNTNILMNKGKYNDDDVLVIAENISNVVRLDNILIVENNKTKEQFAFITNEKQNVFCIDVLRSAKFKNEMLTFLNPKQCKQQFEHMTLGYDLTKHITESIVKHDIRDKKIQENILHVKQLLDKIQESINIVDDKVKIAEQEKDTNVMSELYEMRSDLQAIYNQNKQLLSSFVN